MKKFLVILLFALATCAVIEESFDEDENVVLEKKPFGIKIKAPKLKVPKVKVPKVKVPKVKVPKVKVPKVKVPKVKVPKIKLPKINLKNIVKRTVSDIKKFKIKGLNGIFKGKLGNAFRKLGDVVKKGIAFLKQNNLWDPIVNQLKELGGRYGNELCEKVLPAEICWPAVDFALNNILKTEEEEN